MFITYKQTNKSKSNNRSPSSNHHQLLKALLYFAFNNWWYYIIQIGYHLLVFHHKCNVSLTKQIESFNFHNVSALWNNYKSLKGLSQSCSSFPFNAQILLHSSYSKKLFPFKYFTNIKGPSHLDVRNFFFLTFSFSYKSLLFKIPKNMLTLLGNIHPFLPHLGMIDIVKNLSMHLCNELKFANHLFNHDN